MREQVVNGFKESQEILNILLSLLITLITATNTKSGQFLFIEQHHLMMPLLFTIVLYSLFSDIRTILEIYNGRFLPIIICVMLIMASTAVFLLLRTISTTLAWISLLMWVGVLRSIDYDYAVQIIKNCINSQSNGAMLEEVSMVNVFKELQEILNKSLTQLIALIAALNTDSGKNLFMEQHDLKKPLLLTIVLYSFFAIIGTILKIYNYRRFLAIIILTMPIMGGVAAFMLSRTISITFAWISLAMWVGTFILITYDYVVHHMIKNCIKGLSHGARNQVLEINVFKELREIFIAFVTLLITLIIATNTDLRKLFNEEHKVLMPLFYTIVLYSLLAMIGTILNGRFLPIIICTMLITGGAAIFLILRIILTTLAWINLAVWIGTFTVVAYDSGVPRRIKNWIKGQFTRARLLLLPL